MMSKRKITEKAPHTTSCKLELPFGIWGVCQCATLAEVSRPCLGCAGCLSSAKAGCPACAVEMRARRHLLDIELQGGAQVINLAEEREKRRRRHSAICEEDT